MSLAEEVPDLRDRSFSSLFSHALRGVPCRVLGLDGGPTELPVHEWTRAADPHDDALLAECVGDTLDVGCGPGRLAQRLAEGRDRRVLGIDVVPEAVAQTRARGTDALGQRIVFFGSVEQVVLENLLQVVPQLHALFLGLCRKACAHGGFQAEGDVAGARHAFGAALFLAGLCGLGCVCLGLCVFFGCHVMVSLPQHTTRIC